MGKDIHVVSMDVEAIAAIKKNSKNNNTKGCVMDGMYNIVNDPEIFILETA